jgi:hypothetical protein
LVGKFGRQTFSDVFAREKVMKQNDPLVQAQLIQKLRDRICSVEVGARAGSDQTVSSGCVVLDCLLPAGGYGRGSLVQWITAGGNGADYLSLLTAREACRDGGSLVVIDPANQFYPPAAAVMGLPLERTIILRDQATRASSRARSLYSHSVAAAESLEDNDFLWSIDQALRCPAVAAVWGPMDTIDARWFRRFQLSAESSGCLGLFVQPLSAASAPTWADVQWHVHGLNSTNQNSYQPDRNEQLVQLTLNRCRGTFAGKTICLGINTVTGDVQEARGGSAANQQVLPHQASFPLPLVTETFAGKQV